MITKFHDAELINVMNGMFDLNENVSLAALYRRKEAHGKPSRSNSQQAVRPQGEPAESIADVTARCTAKRRLTGGPASGTGHES